MKKLFIILFLFCAWNISAQTHQDEILAFQKELNAEYLNPEESPLSKKEIKSFKGHDFFPIEEKFKVLVNFKKVDDALPFLMKTSTDRLPSYKIYGTATFEIDGENFILNLYQSEKITPGYENYLFLPFTDLTNGKTSYGGGRYIDVLIPEGNTVVIDFNKAYNPYCAYSRNYSCPIPPKENDLPIKILAGTKYNPKKFK